MLQNLDLPNAIFIDTETTGLGVTDEVIELAAIDVDGRVLLDTLIRPTIPVGLQAQAIHGITSGELAGAPEFPAIWANLLRAVSGRPIVMYGADFDTRMLRQSAAAHTIDFNAFCPSEIQCAMHAYAEHRRVWNVRQRSFRWHKLTTACEYEGIHLPAALAPHRARADAELTRRLVLKFREDCYGAD